MKELGDVDPIDIIPTPIHLYGDSETLSYISKMQGSEDPETIQKISK